MSQGAFLQALDTAIQSFDVIDAMMQFERKYEKRQFDRIEAIDIVLRYAPILFHTTSLEALNNLLKNQKRIDKNADADLAADLRCAYEKMWIAHALWEHLERSPSVPLGELSAKTQDQRQARAILNEWVRMGLVDVTGATQETFVRLATNLLERVPAICSLCGVHIQGTKYKLLESRDCPGCHRPSTFVLIAAQ